MTTLALQRRRCDIAGPARAKPDGIAGLSGGGYEVAFQESNGDLWTEGLHVGSGWQLRTADFPSGRVDRADVRFNAREVKRIAG